MFKNYLNNNDAPSGHQLNKGLVESPGSNARAFNSPFSQRVDARTTSASQYSQSHTTIDVPVDCGISRHLIRPKTRAESKSCDRPLPTEDRPKSLPPTVTEDSATSKKAGETKTLVHFYSPAIAKELNPKQPDIAAAVILYNLSLWQKNTYKQTSIDGRRYCFRSLAELNQNMPYLTKAAIHKAIIRLEKCLGNEFKILRDKEKLWFSIGDETMMKMSKHGRKAKDRNKMHSFLVSDAIETDSIRAAVLLSNLKHQLDHFTDPVRDEAGNPYAELSPKKLCPILGFSEDTISRTLSDMIDSGKIHRHPQRTSFFALSQVIDGENGAPKHSKSRPAKVHTQPAKVHSRPAEVHTQPAEVHSTTHETALEPLITLGVQRDDKVPYINECINEYSNECIKGRIRTANASHCCHDSSPSKGLLILESLACVKLSEIRSSNASNQTSIDLPPEVWDSLLPYDFVQPVHRVFNEFTDANVCEVKEFWKIHGVKMDKEDSSKLRQFFHDNPGIDSCDLCGLYENIVYGPLLVNYSGPMWRSSILTRVKTAKAFLRYLPQIIVLVHQSDGEDPDDVQIPEPWNNLDYSYLGRAPDSKLVKLEGVDVPKRYVN